MNSHGSRVGSRDNRRYKPISDYGIIGDMHSCALVGTDGSIDWACFPRFDSPSVFAAILDSERGGSYQISPNINYSSEARYEDDSNILATTFTTDEGTARLTDFMPCIMERGSLKSYHEIIRRVDGLTGSVPMSLIFKPRLNYAKGETRFTLRPRTALATNGRQKLRLVSDVDLTRDDGQIKTGFRVKEGETLWFVTKYGGTSPEHVSEHSPELEHRRTRLFWTTWARHCSYKGRWQAEVIRSALTLKMLEYVPTGTLVAAATTSLPEAVGSGRNWDYRYTWLRDSAFSLYALNLVGQYAESSSFLYWFLSVAKKSGVNLQIMYGVDGEKYLKEEKLDHLEGYKGSKPVRVGNAAYEQFQLDVYGIVVDAIYFSRWYVQVERADVYEEVRNIVDFVARVWQNKDEGVWEIRGEPQHYVHSKMWAYVALDRGVRFATELGYLDDAERWRPVRESIKKDILDKGWSAKKRAFTMYYGSEDLDASNLLMPLVRFLPASHPKMKATIERTMQELTRDGLVMRYKKSDNLQGEEGAFMICSFWLVDCLTKLGRLKESQKLFEKLLSHANHLGLYSEEIDLKTGEALGNFPQAYTHMALINAAINLDAALSRSALRAQKGSK